MRGRRALAAAGYAALAGGVVVAGCAVVDEFRAGETEPIDQDAKVVVLVPDSGEGAAEGDAVAEAVERSLAEVQIPGWSVTVERVDDRGTGEGAASAADEIASDADVIAVIGGVSSETVRAAQPALGRARIPFISPADDAIEHTHGADPAAPQRPYETYFRMAIPGDDEFSAAIDYAIAGLNAAAIVIVTDDRIADAGRLARMARRRGLEVMTGDLGEVDEALSEASDGDASVVYVAGDAALAAEVATAVAASPHEATILTGPDVRTDEYLSAAGAAAEGTIAFEPAAADPVEGIPVPGLDDAGRFGAAAYDAGIAVAHALEQCLPPVRGEAARSARGGCVAELSTVSFDGLTGTVTFNSFGDRPGAFPPVFVAGDGIWLELGTS